MKELVMAEKWVRENGVIRLLSPLVSDGTTGEGWIHRLIASGHGVDFEARRILLSSGFVPSTAGTRYMVAVLDGSLFDDKKRTYANIGAMAKRLGLKKTHAEVACMVRMYLTNDDVVKMGFYQTIAIHNPFVEPDGFQYLLSPIRYDSSDYFGGAQIYCEQRWGREYGFVLQQK